MTGKKRNFWIIGIVIAIVSFTALYTGVRFVLNNAVKPRNFIAYLILSLILGAVSSVLYLFKLKIVNACFLLGVLIGYLEMYRAFLSNLSGWEDLAGFMSLFLWIGIGLSSGALAQLGRYAYVKFRYRDRND